MNYFSIKMYPTFYLVKITKSRKESI